MHAAGVSFRPPELLCVLCNTVPTEFSPALSLPCCLGYGLEAPGSTHPPGVSILVPVTREFVSLVRRSVALNLPFVDALNHFSLWHICSHYVIFWLPRPGLLKSQRILLPYPRIAFYPVAVLSPRQHLVHPISNHHLWCAPLSWFLALFSCLYLP